MRIWGSAAFLMLPELMAVYIGPETAETVGRRFPILLQRRSFLMGLSIIPLSCRKWYMKRKAFCIWKWDRAQTVIIMMWNWDFVMAYISPQTLDRVGSLCKISLKIEDTI